MLVSLKVAFFVSCSVEGKYILKSRHIQANKRKDILLEHLCQIKCSQWLLQTAFKMKHPMLIMEFIAQHSADSLKMSKVKFDLNSVELKKQ